MRRLVIAIATLSGCTETDLSHGLFVCDTNRGCPPGDVCSDDRRVCITPAQLEAEPFLQSGEVGAMLVMKFGGTRYWYAEQTILRSGAPLGHMRAFDDDNEVHRVDQRLLGVVHEDGVFRGYLSNGTTAIGDGYEFGFGVDVVWPTGKTTANVVGVARSPDEAYFAFFDDSTFVRSTRAADFSGSPERFEVAEAKTATAVAAMTFDDDGILYSVCHDGTVLAGNPTNLSSADARPGRIVAGFSTRDDDLVVAYASGYLKVFEGRVTKNWSAPTAWAGDWRGQRLRWEGYAEYATNPRNIVGIARVQLRSVTSTLGPCVEDLHGGDVVVYYRHGLLSAGEGERVEDDRISGVDLSSFVDDGVTVQAGAFEEVIDVSFTSNEEAVCAGEDSIVWLRSGLRLRGGPRTLGNYEGTDTRNLWSGAHSLSEVEGIVNDAVIDGFWTLYRDGTFSRGWTQCLCGFCATPAAMCSTMTHCSNERLIDDLPIDCRTLH